MKEKPMLILIRGIPGSGKSTYAKEVMAELADVLGEDCLHFEADRYMMVNGEYIFEPEKLKAAHQWCQTSTFNGLLAGSNVIVSNTFTTMKELEPYIKFAEAQNIDYQVIRMETFYGSIHNVPEEKIQQMRSRFQDFEGELIVS